MPAKISPENTPLMDPVQQTLRFPCGWGGKRPNAGRPKLPRRKSVPHRPRPEHKARNPAHLTLRVRRGLPSLRRQALFVKVRHALANASGRSFRVVHFSVQADHIHLIIETHDKVTLQRGARGVAIRIARAVNRHLDRRGRVLADRYHARALESPREVRNAIVYVIQNWQKHVTHAQGVDGCSSGWWFTGWKAHPSGGSLLGDDDEPAPVRVPLTWLGARGWQKHGLIGADERPKPRIDRSSPD